MSDEEKIGVYVCTGCSIGQNLDAGKLAEVAADFQLAAQAYPPLCIPEGLETLQAEIQHQGVEKAVIAACSSRVNWDVFSKESLGVNLVERVNIRELVAWSKPAQNPETQALAEDYLRMGITRAQRTTSPVAATRATIEQTILIVGGGITGITAALEVAEAGSDVILVEKQANLGGWLAKFHKLFPTQAPYRDLEVPDIEGRIQALEEKGNVKVFTSAEIKEISGEPGDLTVVIEHNNSATTVRAGALILATGWQPADLATLDHLGFGKHADVITNVMLEAIAKAGPILRPSDGQPAKSVAFVQRPHAKDQYPYSFGADVIDMASLKQALYVRERNPNASVFIFYEDMVTPGLYEEFYRRVQQEPQVFLVRGEVTAVAADSGGGLVVYLEHSLLGERAQVPADLVVLATGMSPSTAASPVLNLLYEQGPGLPTAKYGFADSNFICFPYESQRTGFFAAGSVREPMDAVSSMEDAAGAGLKAIQSLALIGSGGATHPRSGDLSLPVTRLSGCTKCGRCSQECPFSAIEVNAQGFPELNADRCRRCGICMGACPVQVISFDDYSVEQLSAMIKAIRFPEDETQLRLVALVCENDAYPAFDMAGINRLISNASLRVLPLRCLGSLNSILIADALSHGIDGVLLMGCKAGTDYQCHFIRGSELGSRRMENVRETLSRLMLEPERVKTVEVEITDYNSLPDIVNEFVAEIQKIGPNPFKGF